MSKKKRGYVRAWLENKASDWGPFWEAVHKDGESDHSGTADHGNMLDL